MLAPAATLTGVVRDATGALEPFAWVWLAGPACADGPRKLRADARGRFACDGLAAGALELTALANDPDAPGFARAEITLAEGEAFPWEPRLGPAPRLTGRVRDARGRPVANAPVRIERAARAFACDEADLLGERQGSVRVTSAADGSFGAFAFPDEAYVVCLLDADDLTRVLDWDARATAGGPPVELVAAPDRGPTTLLVGRALDADGLPARGAEVQLAGPLLLRTLRCPVDPVTGDFLVPPLTAAPYRARLWRAGQAPQALADGAWIELAPGEARAFGDVVLAPPESVRD
ncbi:MAG: carboxypeptidase regulatory-like domain-containing protein [Planctomycetes bacterium]|nr:carboxypeptidase regulatory-like domain-containing protein [Planctomycetota bacterium]